jgi:hypothetical protein
MHALTKSLSNSKGSSSTKNASLRQNSEAAHVGGVDIAAA